MEFHCLSSPNLSPFSRHLLLLVLFSFFPAALFIYSVASLAVAGTPRLFRYVRDSDVNLEDAMWLKNLARDALLTKRKKPFLFNYFVRH